MNDMINLLNQAVSSDIWSAVQTAFDQMRVTDNLVDAAVKKYRRSNFELALKIWNAWLAYGQHHPLMNTCYRPELYEAHVRELIERTINGKDLRPGTEAEILLVISRTSTVAPLDDNAASLYAKLFIKVFPKTRVAMEIAQPLTDRERWAKACDDQLATLRKKTSNPERVIRPRSEWAVPKELRSYAPQSVLAEFGLLESAAD